jgi:hypothetical protein
MGDEEGESSKSSEISEDGVKKLASELIVDGVEGASMSVGEGT